MVADFSTVDETADGGADFISSSGTITFAPGVTTRTIVVPTIDDAIPELDETFHVSLSNPVGATIVDSEAVGTILDDGDVGNQAPSADAGADQTLSDNDGTGSELVTLSGSGTDPDGSIVAYEWTEGATVLGNSASISPTLGVGTHILTLTVTDNEGATGSDTVVVTIDANQGPSANAGADQSDSDADGSGDQIVTLTGSGSDADGSVVSYQWTEGGTVLGNTAAISPSLSVGTHTLTLTVTDNGGATASDTVLVTVAANQAPTAAPVPIRRSPTTMTAAAKRLRSTAADRTQTVRSPRISGPRVRPCWATLPASRRHFRLERTYSLSRSLTTVAPAAVTMW